MAVSSTTNQAYSAYKTNNKMQVEKNEKAEEKKTVKLSENAKKYLENLKKKYGNVDFIVADYADDDEASEHLSKGKGEYNCVITPSLLEKMAADESVAAKYEGIIENAGAQFDEVKEKLGDAAKDVATYGITVNGDGEVNYYVLLRDGLSKIEQNKAEKTQDKQAEKTEEKKQKVPEEKESYIRVKASTIEELIEKIMAMRAEREEDKDGFVVEKDDKAWQNVNGQKDGFVEDDPQRYISRSHYGAYGPHGK